MEFKCFTKWNQLPQSSDKLFSQAEQDSLFFSRDWFENLATISLEDKQSLLLACVVGENEEGEENNNVLTILPLISNKNKQWTSLHHLYTSLFTLLITKNNQDNKQQEIINCLAKGLSQLPFDKLQLEPIAKDDENINMLRQALESTGFSCTRYARFYNWFHPLQGQAFADYMQARPSKVRNTIARKQRKLQREHDYEIRLHTGRDVPQIMSDFHTVYKASWKANEPFEKVIEGFINRFSKLSWTRLAILCVDEQPIAAQIWFVVHKKANIFKLAYDEKWKQYSPGSILTQCLMEHVIDADKVEEIDYLTGNDRYKQDWMTERRRRWRMVCMRKQKPEEKRNAFIRLIALIGLIKNWQKN